jgi:HEAT repeat protein
VIHAKHMGVVGARLILLLGVSLGSVAWAGQIEDLARTIEKDRSEKARIAAVVTLGNLADPRGVPTLVRALADSSPVVRGVAATALGHIRDPRAIPALERALDDESEGVRTRARDALSLFKPAGRGGGLRGEASSDPSDEPVLTHARVIPREAPRRGYQGGAKLYVVVKEMGGSNVRARHELTARMKSRVIAELSGAPELTLDSQMAGDGRLAQFVVDGSITRLTRDFNGPWVEITCEVKLTVSDAKGAIRSMVSGGATVQTARGAYRKEMEPALQVEALDGAVRGAHQNLLNFLVKQIASK